MNQNFNPNTLADAMMRRLQVVMGQREEILEAFVAKYGFNPDEAEQVETRGPDGFSKWSVVRLDPETAETIRAEVLRHRFSTQKLTRWKRFCLWLAELGS